MEQGNTGINFRGTGEQVQVLRGTGEQRQYWGTGNIENKFSILGEQGNKPIYFRGTREQVPPMGGPQYVCLTDPNVWATHACNALL